MVSAVPVAYVDVRNSLEQFVQQWQVHGICVYKACQVFMTHVIATYIHFILYF